jgi:hypothetical protein
MSLWALAAEFSLLNFSPYNRNGKNIPVIGISAIE